MATQQEAGSSVNVEGEKAELNEGALRLIKEDLARGEDLVELLGEFSEYGDDGENLIQEALRFGLGLKEAMTWPDSRDLRMLLEKAFEANINPEGWNIVRAERLVDGKRVPMLIAEFDDPEDRDNYLPCRRQRFEVSHMGMDCTANAPPAAVLMRALRAALGGAS